MVELHEIEDGILTELRTNAKTKLVQDGGPTKLIDSYAGQFEQAMEDVIVLFPCLFAVFVDAQYEEYTHTSYRGDPAVFAVLVADQNLRGNKEARRGAPGSIGTMQMMTDVRNALLDKNLGLDITPLALRRAVAVVNTPELSVYAMEFVTSHVVDSVE